MNLFDAKRFVKTSCGRAKLSELSQRKSFSGRIRLYWFILIATIRDWNLPVENYNKESDS